MPDHQPDPTQSAWLAGLQQFGTRPLVPDEIAQIRALSGGLRAKGRATLITGCVLGAIILIVVALTFRNGRIPPLVGVLLFLATFIAPLGALLTRDWLRRAEMLHRDAEAGWVRQFTGQLTTDSDETRDRLVARRLLHADPALTQWLEVLPSSNFVWTANSYRVPTLVTAVPNLPAGLPEYAATAAQWVEPAQHPGNEGIHLNFRELSAPEREELQKHGSKLLLRPLGVALLFTVWAAVPLFTDVMKDSPLAPLVFGGFALWSWLSVIRSAALVAKIRRDVEIGRVVIVRRTLEATSTIPGQPELSPADEFLPESGIPWTTGTRPAPWRLSSSK